VIVSFEISGVASRIRLSACAAVFFDIVIPEIKRTVYCCLSCFFLATHVFKLLNVESEYHCHLGM